MGIFSRYADESFIDSDEVSFELRLVPILKDISADTKRDPFEDRLVPVLQDHFKEDDSSSKS